MTSLIKPSIFAVVVSALCLASPAVGLADKKKPSLPLEGSTEKLTFETSEGTWMSLDLAADGETIIFELMGDLYELPVTGGEAKRITSGLGYDSMPRVSPDGKYIAFISDRDGDDNLWVANRDGTKPRKLSGESHTRLVSPAWSPDSQYVVMTTGGRETQIKMYHIDGGGGVALSNNEGKPVAGVGAVFSPDNSSVYFTVASGGNGFPAGQISRFDRITGEIDSITQGEGGGIRPAISPNGRLLAYLSRIDTATVLRVQDLVTGSDRVVTRSLQRDAQEAGRMPSRDYFPSYAFTADSDAIILNTDGGFERVDIASGNRSKIEFSATVDLDIGPDLTAPYRVPQGDITATIAHSPSVAPDGEKVAASVLTKIYVMNTDEGAAPERLTESDSWEFQPVWSPDGRWIAYVTWTHNDGGHIWKIRSNGRGRPQQLTTHPGFYTDIAWSPDGERIVAMRGSGYKRNQLFSEFFGLNMPLDLVWVPENGGDTSLVARANGARSPHFGPEADRIYINDGGTLASLRYDGSDRREHLTVTVPRGNRLFGAEPPKAESLRISPNGEHALAFAQDQIWVMAVPKLGGKTPTVAIRSPSVPAKQLTSTGADFFGWSADGSRIEWAIGNTLYTQAFDTVEFRKDEEDKSEEKAEGEQAKEEGKDTETAPEIIEDNENVTKRQFAVTVPRSVPEGSILLTGANVITMRGETTADMASVLENHDVLVTNNRIVAIAPTGAVTVPSGTATQDISGKYIVPGFVDTHAHWEFRTSDVLEPKNWSLVANLAYGVTAGLDVQTNYHDYFTYRDMVETGQSVGQRAFMTGPGIFGNTDFQSYDAAYAFLKRYSHHYQTHNIKAYLTGNRKQRQWVVKAAKDQGLLPTTEGGGDMRLDITHAIDGMHGNEHTLTIAPMHKDVIELYAKTKTAYTPTLLVQYNGISGVHHFFTKEEVHDDEKLKRFYPHNRLDELTRRRGFWARDDEFTIDEIASAAADLQRAGGLVGVGGHGELQGLGYHWEMWAFAMGGMTPAEILRAATIDGARIVGIEQDLGSLEAGKLADMVVLDKNPLEDIRNTDSIHMVMKNGELYDGDTLNQVWPVQKELEPFWWWDEGSY